MLKNAPLTQRALRLLAFAYMSAIVVALLLLGAAQGLVQWSLAREQHERQVAAQVNAQALRTQRMYLAALFLQNPRGSGTDYNALTARLEVDEPTWEAVQAAMDDGGGTEFAGMSSADFSASSQAVLARERAGFERMRAAYRHALALEAAGHPASPDAVRPDIVVIYQGEGAYLASLVAVYTDETSAADDLLAHVRLIEFVLFCATLAVVACEVLLVVRPALKLLAGQLHDFETLLAARAAPPSPDEEEAP